MLTRLGKSKHIYVFDNVSNCKDRHAFVAEVGVKASGLSLLPKSWTPPFFIVSTEAYSEWCRTAEPNEFVTALSGLITEVAEGWQEEWKNGILLRSSAINENLGSRGQNESVELPADYNAAVIADALTKIYEQFANSAGDNQIAVVVQARVATRAMGHLSNERRVSITENRWVFEVEHAGEVPKGFNSQRAEPPAESERLSISAPAEQKLLRRFKELARWCTQLGEGRAHLEWGATIESLWIFQLDFENDFPDEGHNPEQLLRNTDLRAAGNPPPGSPFRPADFANKTGWRKIDKVENFMEGRRDPYPKLFWITGDEFVAALSQGKNLLSDLASIVHGRAICRTDCSNEAIPSLNLPRTESVREDSALRFMEETIDLLVLKGAEREEICFILHKFIPAAAAAWAVAYPDKSDVRVDALWGLPDGLQYLPHDTFEFNVAENIIVSERIRYKPKFLQETEDGSWQVVQVARQFTRRRSLSKGDLAEVASHTHQISKRLARPIQIMWFCGIPEELSVGRNVPWFSMQPEHNAPKSSQISPALIKYYVRTIDDVERSKHLARGKYVLYLDPQDPDLFRSNDFLDAVASVANCQNFPIVVIGSVLGHAFYMLDRRGLSVFAADEPTRSRIRQQRIFNKIVRDLIPEQINERGETTVLAKISKRESRAALCVKLLEELFELLDARSPQEVTGELADLLEVVRSLSASTGAIWEEVENFADNKKQKRGSFERNVVLVQTALSGRHTAKQLVDPPFIKLSDLSKSISDGLNHFVPFSVLLSEANFADIKLSDGRQIRISIGGNGIKVDEEPLIQISNRQLSLDF